jgi:hypothetical protein
VKTLIRIIGQAPSELTVKDFVLYRLAPERARQEKSLSLFRQGVIPSWKKKKTVKKAKKASTSAPVRKAQIEELTALAKEAGLSLVDFINSLKD